MLSMMDAAQIKAARERVSESQEDFAKRFGVDQTTISRWEISGPPREGAAKKLLEFVVAQIETGVN